MQRYRNDEKSKDIARATKDALWQDPVVYLRRAHLFGLVFAASVWFIFRNSLTTPQLIILFTVLWAASQLVFLYITVRIGKVRYSWQHILVEWLKGYILAIIILFVLNRIGWLQFPEWF